MGKRWISGFVTILLFAGATALGACTEFKGWSDYGPDAACEPAGCDCQTSPLADVVDVVDDVATPAFTCGHCLESMVGKALRFTSLEVTKPVIPDAGNPEALPDFLNDIWQVDVARYVLNIMLGVDSVDVTTGTLQLTAGAAWHDLAFDDLPDDETGAGPTKYALLPGYTSSVVVTLDSQCRITIQSPVELKFHPGPESHPTICAPELVNAANPPAVGGIIPIKQLRPEGRVASDCSGVIEGELTGCIAKADADRICSWFPAPNYDDWYFERNETIDAVVGDLDYCRHWCGTIPGEPPGSTKTKWTNFGAFVTLVEVPPDCDSDGDEVPDGYGIAGHWTANLVDLGATLE